jgi:uncharacterized protein
MRINLGNVADGENYFERPHLNAKFWRLLAKSGHLSIVAPRRVGKTSLMSNIVATPVNGYKILYTITESVNDLNEFFRKIYKELLASISKSNKFKELIDDVYKKLKIKKISLTGIEFEKEEIDFFEEIKYLLKNMKEKDDHIILMIDEFSQTLENIIKDKGENAAKLFLHQCRELRIDKDCRDKISFIYTGSIGLENLVVSIDEAKSISDIGRFEMPTLSLEEAKAFIEKILNNEGWKFDEMDQNYFLEKLRWLLPYHIHVIMSEVEEIGIAENSKNITQSIIDKAFENSLSNRTYFEHWLSRLRIMFSGQQFSCTKEMLKKTALNNWQSKYDYFDIANKHKIDDANMLINILIHDGYIVIENKSYRFNSPLLQEWWLRNVVN